jgi:uncharacterized phage protein gp47/JayE
MTITRVAPTLDAEGIHAPTYPQLLDYLQAQYRAIYGTDTYLGADSQDGQFLAILAKAMDDTNALAVQIYQSFSPATAAAAALANNVKLNGIRRKSASHATVDIELTGQVGTTISHGVVADAAGQRWNLPDTVTIPPAGQVTVTAVSEAPGAVLALPGSITRILTPVLGWQSVTNHAASVPGVPVESDAALRQRQIHAVALPSRTVLDGLMGAVASIDGVTRWRAYENDTHETDAKGVPPHSLALVVEGGDAAAIAQAIALKKTPGAGTYGNTAVTVTDAYGLPITIRFQRPESVSVSARITIKALAGYNATVGAAMQHAVVDYINGVPIGGGVSGTVEWCDALTTANRVAGNTTFKITSLTLNGPQGTGTPDIPLDFHQVATCTPDDVSLQVQ